MNGEKGSTLQKTQIPLLGVWSFIAGWMLVLGASTSPAQLSPTDPQLFRGWVTNGPAVFAGFKFPPPPPLTNSLGGRVPRPGSGLLANMTNLFFDHFLHESLNYVTWTNIMARTNGRTSQIWSERTRPTDWPTNPPALKWNTHCLLYGMKGFTALSPSWENEGGPGQVPVTALTRRHGYARGHSMGDDGFRTDNAGKKIWFLTADNKVIQARVAREVVRTMRNPREDYTILLFNQDLPASIQSLRVTSFTNLLTKYPAIQKAPWPLFMTEQSGYVSATIPGFTVETWKGGDSGSPNLLPLGDELIFVSGRSTSGPTAAMQEDMDELCRQEGLNPRHYQLQWVDLSAYPSY
jgi:hypothetical protein